jgi:hypothetical protein
LRTSNGTLALTAPQGHGIVRAMGKKKTGLVCISTAAALAAVLVLGGLILRHEPNFYRTRIVEPGPERKALSTKFINDFAQLCLDLKGNGPDGWHFAFSEAEINSFFQEDFLSQGDVENLRKVGISEPRIAFVDDGIRFAFRYGSGLWSTVLSYDLRIWAVSKEANVVAVELRGRRIGALPMSSQALLTELTEIAAKYNIEVTSYRYEGHPVAVIHLTADQLHPTAQLKCLHVTPGVMHVDGACPLCAQPGSTKR